MTRAVQADDEALFVVVTSPSRAVGFAAETVRAVHPIDQWTGPAPIDVDVTLFGDAPEALRESVLVTQAKDDQTERPLRVRGEVKLRTTRRAGLLALPTLLRTSNRSAAIAGVVIEGNDRFLVLEPRALEAPPERTP